MDNIGYHVGSLKFPTGTLESFRFNFNSNGNYLGTGYYFFSSIEDAKKYSNYARLDNKDEIYQFDISKYNLYKPVNSTRFYNYIRTGVKNFSISIDDSLLAKFIKVGQDEFGILLKENVYKKIIEDFNNNVLSKNNGPLLSNHLLSPLGFEGINNINNKLDNMKAGSLLFKIKEGTYKELSQQNESLSRKWLRRKLKGLKIIKEESIIDDKKYLILLNKALNYCCQDLNIPLPKVKIINNPSYTEQNNSYGGYQPDNNQIYLVIYNRTLADSMRSLCHEIYHHYQNYNNILSDNAGEDGDVFENEANSYSGKIMRELGRKYPEIFFTKYSA